MDRIVLGDFRDEAERVVILGGGLAGLTAAYHLKKNNIHFHVYEASQRIGGRVYSVPEFFRGQSVAELGAEFFTAEQKLVIQLAQELRLDTVEIPEIQSRARIRRLQKMLPLQSLDGELRRLQKSVSRGENPENLRSQSLQTWVQSRTRESFFLDLVNAWTLEKYGVTCDEVASEVFSSAFDRNRTPLSQWTDSRYRFRGGLGSLVQALFDRTAGFQPERSYSFQHRLRAVQPRSRGMDLVFETPEGTKSVFARHVICALPMAVLNDVEGLPQFPGPWSEPNAFRVGAHSKFVYSYQDRFWGGAWDQSKLLQFGPGQTVWESSYRLNPLFQFRQGVLSLLWGGEASKSAGPHHQLEFQRQLESFFGKKPEVKVQDQAMANWSIQPFAKGSVSYPRVGGNPEAWATNLEHWAWAGEHTEWLERGTLQGAISSGLKAAEAIVSRRPERLFPV